MNWKTLSSYRNAFALLWLVATPILVCSDAFAQGAPQIQWMRQGHSGLGVYLAFSPDGKLLASGGGDGAIRIWKASDGTLVRTLLGHTSNVYGLAFSPNGRQLASAGYYDGTVRIWRVRDGLPIASFETGGYVLRVAYSPDGSEIAVCGGITFTGDPRNVLRIYRTSDWSLIGSVPVPDEGASVAYSPSGTEIALGSYHTLHIINRSDLSVSTFQTTSGYIYSLQYSPDGNYLGTGNNGDFNAGIWSTAGWSETILAGHTSWVTSVAFSPDSRVLLSCGQLGDGSLRFWSVPSGTLLKYYDQTGGGGVDGVAFAPNGRTFAYGRLDGVIVMARTPRL